MNIIHNGKERGVVVKKHYIHFIPYINNYKKQELKMQMVSFIYIKECYVQNCINVDIYQSISHTATMSDSYWGQNCANLSPRIMQASRDKLNGLGPCNHP